MTKQEQTEEIVGVVVESLPNTMFKIQVSPERTILATVAGRMRRHFIRILPGDKVRVEVTPYDPNRGRIIWRER